MGGQHQCTMLHQCQPSLQRGGQHWGTLVHQCQLHPYLPRHSPCQHFSSFCDFQLDLCAAFRRPFLALSLVLLLLLLLLIFFFQFSYSRKARDVQFPMVLASFNLELWSLRYCTWKGGDAKLKNSERLPLKNSYLLIRS